jgi:hypothetical protein
MRPNYPQDVASDWEAAWGNATSDASTAGVLVDWPAEAPALLDDRFLALVSRAARADLISRWGLGFMDKIAPMGSGVWLGWVGRWCALVVIGEIL